MDLDSDTAPLLLKFLDSVLFISVDYRKYCILFVTVPSSLPER